MCMASDDDGLDGACCNGKDRVRRIDRRRDGQLHGTQPERARFNDNGRRRVPFVSVWVDNPRVHVSIHVNMEEAAAVPGWRRSILRSPDTGADEPVVGGVRGGVVVLVVLRVAVVRPCEAQRAMG